MYSVQSWQLPTGFFGTAGGIVATLPEGAPVNTKVSVTD